MADKKKRVNAKRFLEDFRSGKSREELMKLHGLDDRTLDKLFDMLLERRLLDRSELRKRLAQASEPLRDEELGSFTRPVSVPPPQPLPMEKRATNSNDPLSQCPQCGAAVSARSLICPECGHVLPGKQRWEQVEPKRRVVDRIPPLMWGVILAVPFALMLFFLFKDVILPVAEEAIDQRIEDLRRETPQGKTPMQAAKSMTKDAGMAFLESQIKIMTSQDLLSAVDKEYRTFTTGSLWAQFPAEEQVRNLYKIRDAMKGAKIEVDFQVVNPAGQVLARVTEHSVEVVVGMSPQLGNELEGKTPALPLPSATDIDAVKRAVTPQLPGGMKRPLEPRPGR